MDSDSESVQTEKGGSTDNAKQLVYMDRSGTLRYLDHIKCQF